MTRAAVKPTVAPQREPSAGRKPGAAAPVVAPVANGPLGMLYSAGPALGLASGVQCKVVVGPPDDPYEREADRVAERVSSGGPVMRISRLPANGLSAAAQRMTQPDEEEEPAQTLSVQRQATDEEEEEPAQTLSVQREAVEEKEEEPAQTLSVQRQVTEEEEEPAQTLSVQRQATEEEEEPAQTLSVQRQATEEEEEPAQTLSVQRQATDDEEEEPAQTLSVQRQVIGEEEEPAQTLSVQREAVEKKEEEPVQPQSNGQRGPSMATAAAQAIHGRGAGVPLLAATRASMERSLGVDLGDVRVHATGSAHAAARALHARAFTHRNHIWLGAGESQADLRLMAHETTHVLQQDGVVRRKPVESAPKTPLSSPTATARDPGEDKDDEVLVRAGQPDAASAEAPDETSQTVERPAQSVLGAWAQASQPSRSVPGVPATSKSAERDEDQSAPDAAEPGPDAGRAAGEEKAAVAGEQEAGKQAATQPAVPTQDAPAASAEPKAPTSPQEDPAYQRVIARTRRVARRQGHNNPAARKAAEAQAAAKGPSNEVASQAAASQVAKIDAQQPKPFDKAGFKAALLTKIAEITPKTQKEADEFKQNGKVGAVKSAVTSSVAAGKEAAQGGIEQATKETPDPSGAQPKQVTPLIPFDAGPPPADVGATQAAPKPKTDGEVSLEEGSKSLDDQMADANVTEEQLANSNEPEFTGALGAKKEAQADAQAAPTAYREQEQGILAGARAQAVGSVDAQFTGMHQTRKGEFSAIEGQQDVTKTTDEQKRAEVATNIERIYRDTKQKVEGRLSKLDGDVNRTFDTGAEAARQKFEDYVASRMHDYKLRRYLLVPGGSVLWVKDQFLGLPDEVNAFYVAGRDLYISLMDTVIDDVASQVETGLGEAKEVVATGLSEVKTYVDGLPEGLREVGQKAQEGIQEKFDALRETVDAKQGQLVDTLAQKYVDNLQKIDERINQMKEENKGLVDKAKDAIGGVIKTILELKEMLMGVLARAADAIDKIIKDPIGFVGNLAAGVKAGLQSFVANIGTHLQKGLMGWLFGALAEAGIQMPESFDLKGILSLVLQVLGLIYVNIRARAVRMFGEPVVKALETGAEIFKVLITQGPAGLWSYIKDQIGDLKSMIIDGIRDFVIEKIIVAGITWIISLLNPASAFVKACKAIYDIIMFFVSRASQIMSLVNAVIDSISAIASGSIGAVASAVENALSKAVPVAISFLASLLGLGGISEKIRSIIQKIQAPVNKAIDWVLGKAKSLLKSVGKLFGGGKKSGSSQQKLSEGMTAAQAAVARFSGKRVGAVVLKPLLAAIRVRYGLKSLELGRDAGKWTVTGSINPTAKVTTEALAEGSESEDLTFEELWAILMGSIQSRPPAAGGTQISPSSFSYTVKVIGHLIETSPASEKQKEQAISFLLTQAAKAWVSSDSHIIYKALQQAAGALKRLHGTTKSVVQIHHEQEVSQHPETFAETQRERVRLPKALETQLEGSIKKIHQKYSAEKGKSKKEKLALAKKDIAELQELIKDSLLDWKTSRQRDEKGKRTKEAAPAMAQEKPMEEIDLVALSVKAHIEVHRRRKKK